MIKRKPKDSCPVSMLADGTVIIHRCFGGWKEIKDKYSIPGMDGDTCFPADKDGWRDTHDARVVIEYLEKRIDKFNTLWLWATTIGAQLEAGNRIAKQDVKRLTKAVDALEHGFENPVQNVEVEYKGYPLTDYDEAPDHVFGGLYYVQVGDPSTVEIQIKNHLGEPVKVKRSDLSLKYEFDSSAGKE